MHEIRRSALINYFAGGRADRWGRSGIRPQLLWNDGGLAVMRSFTMSVHRWDSIARFDEEFDHAWLWSKISKSYAAREGRNRVALTEALRTGRVRGELVRCSASCSSCDG